MATVTKDFRIKSGLVVEGTTGTINGSAILTEANSTEFLQDTIGGMVSSNTESGISVEYDDTSGKLNFNVSDPVITIAGDVDGNATMTNLGDTTVTVTLDTVNTAVGTYGSTTAIPSITVDGKGRVTNVTTNTISTGLGIAGDAGVDTVSLLTDTLTFEGGTGITSAVSNNKVKFDIDSTVATLSDQQTLTNKVLGTNVDLGANLDAGTYRITNLGAPDQGTDAATKAYVDGVAEGLHIHASAEAATTTNINIANDLQVGDIIDGVTLAATNRVLVKNQTTAAHNGIYVVQSSGSAIRAADFDAPAEVDGGDFIFVTGGNTQADTGWVQTSTGVATIGIDPIYFTQFSGAGTFTAGNGLTLDGTVFEIDENVTATKAHVDLLIGDATVNGTAGNTIGDRLDTLFTDLEDYVDGFLTPSTGTTIEYIDDQDAATLLAANDYTDTEVGIALSYTDTEVAATLLAANGYSDSLVSAGNATATPTYLALDINAVAKQVAASVGPVGATQTVAYAFPKASHRSAKFLVKVAYSTHTEVSEVLLTLDTSDNIAITEYAVVGTNGSSSAISAGISGSNVQLLVTPVNANSTIKVYGTLID
jgi:hypothetical protein